MSKQKSQRSKNRSLRLKLVFSGKRILLCLVLLAVLAGAYYFIPRFFPINVNSDDVATDAELVWHSVDVGQGDCTIVQFPDNKVLMVDAGSELHDRSSTKIMQYLQTWQITTIDWFVITHPDEDHFGGAVKLLKNNSLTFRTLYKSAYNKELSSYQTLISSYPFIVPEDGQTINGIDYTITFVSPFVADNEHVTNPNDASLMMTIEYCNKVFVLTGDASSKMEDDFIEHATDMDIFDDKMNQQIILKVAHHGSRFGSSNKFLDFVFNTMIPENNFALISCGKNNTYQHPHQEVLTRLKNYVSPDHLLITMDTGDIVIHATPDALAINDTKFAINQITYQTIFISLGVLVVTLCFGKFNTKLSRRNKMN